MYSIISSACIAITPVNSARKRSSCLQNAVPTPVTTFVQSVSVFKFPNGHGSSINSCYCCMVIRVYDVDTVQTRNPVHRNQCHFSHKDFYNGIISKEFMTGAELFTTRKFTLAAFPLQQATIHRTGLVRLRLPWCAA